MAGLLLRELGGGEFSQLVIDERQELLGGVGIAGFDLREDAGDIGHGEQDSEPLGETPGIDQCIMVGRVLRSLALFEVASWAEDEG